MTTSSKKKKFVVITENNNHLTGGRYYSWMIAVALKEAGFDVTIYTNAEPTFFKYFSAYKKPKLVVRNCTPKELSLLNIKADVYIGSPIFGNVCAIKNALKYKKQAFPIIFDPLPMIYKFLKKKTFRGWLELTTLLKEPSVKVITLCHATHQYIYNWLNKTEDQLIPIYPSINSVAKKKAKKPSRNNYAVFVSRLVTNKKFDHVVWACRQNNLKLKVITSISGIDHKRIVRAYRMDKQTDFYFNASEEEKFELIRGASVMINGAIFEGFGIWMAEAISCGTPVVCYNYPTLREIADFSGAKNIYFANFNNHKDLSNKLNQCLYQRVFEEEKTMFDFKAMIKRVKEVFKNV